jgi:hypothetical protein
MDQVGNDGSGVVEVTVEDGVVTLTGQVISLSHRRLASVTAWWVGGCPRRGEPAGVGARRSGRRR